MDYLIRLNLSATRLWKHVGTDPNTCYREPHSRLLIPQSFVHFYPIVSVSVTRKNLLLFVFTALRDKVSQKLFKMVVMSVSTIPTCITAARGMNLGSFIAIRSSLGLIRSRIRLFRIREPGGLLARKPDMRAR